MSNIGNNIIRNEIVIRFSKENMLKIQEAKREGKKIFFTFNERTAPYEILSEDEKIHIGIEPEDSSYFDYYIGYISEMLLEDDIKMIREFYNRKGYDKAKWAYENTFRRLNMQYSFDSVLEYLEEIKG